MKRSLGRLRLQSLRRFSTCPAGGMIIDVLVLRVLWLIKTLFLGCSAGACGSADRLHSTDIAYKPSANGWGYHNDYSNNYDNIFKRKSSKDESSRFSHLFSEIEKLDEPNFDAFLKEFKQKYNLH